MGGGGGGDKRSHRINRSPPSVCRGSKYYKVASDWLILDVDLYGTILVGGPLRTQFDDVVVLTVVFFALLSHSIGFQIFGNLKDIPLI